MKKKEQDDKSKQLEYSGCAEIPNNHLSCDGCVHLVGGRYHDCEHDSCLRYAALRGFPDLYTPRDK